MRPPMVRRCNGVPSRGQNPSRARIDWRSPMCDPPRSWSSSQGGPQVAVQPPLLGRVERSGRPGRVEAGSPQDLVGQQVADAGDAGLVEQSGLQRRPAGVERVAQLPEGQVHGVEPEAGLVRVQLHPAESSGVADDQLATLARSARRGDPTSDRSGRAVYSRRAMAGSPSTNTAPVIPNRTPTVGPSLDVEQQQLADPAVGGEATARPGRRRAWPRRARASGTTGPARRPRRRRDRAWSRPGAGTARPRASRARQPVPRGSTRPDGTWTRRGQ